MAQYFSLHPEQPQARLIRQAAEILRGGGLVALPTDSAYALACQVGDAALLDRIRRIRGVDERHHFTLMCRDLSEIGTYARVDNSQYRLLKAVTPGPYTFILEGTREVPKRLLHPKRATLGLRVPDHPVVQALLTELGEPILSATLIPPNEEVALNDPEAIAERMPASLGLIIDAGQSPEQATTVIDLTGAAPEVLRIGNGALDRIGLN